ncbi:hypothetical protein TSAR_012596 [Trichomalopsis sarcophagae]|uniref:Uncharacterized protein n=1 Tax=Trichomalopsis sarcophagae TaxID=543379 RepID=A0A232EEK2_9HYME|nr:hypothetical protein TSAR_012596 [Trichomalopsis sarcophagae]
MRVYRRQFLIKNTIGWSMRQAGR